MKKLFEGARPEWRRTNADKAREIRDMVTGRGSHAIKRLLERTADDLETGEVSEKPQEA